jgi:hypothetical protein
MAIIVTGNQGSYTAPQAATPPTGLNWLTLDIQDKLAQLRALFDDDNRHLHLIHDVQLANQAIERIRRSVIAEGLR